MNTYPLLIRMCSRAAVTVVWRVIAPLLDERTVSRVIWLKNADEMRDHLEERYGLNNVPKWMGGTAQDCTLRLYNHFVVEPEQMAGRF